MVAAPTGDRLRQTRCGAIDSRVAGQGRGHRGGGGSAIVKQDPKGVPTGRRAVSVAATIIRQDPPRSKKEIRRFSAPDRVKKGKKARLDVPLAQQAEWHPQSDRSDPIGLLEG